MDRGQSQIAASNAQAAVGLELVEERGDQRCVDLLEGQVRRRPSEALLGEDQELSERVAIGADGMRTRLALLHQPLGEEAFQQGRESGCAGHGRSSQ